MKAVVLVLSDEVADDVARLIAGTLTLNGYNPSPPAVIDWPESTSDEDDLPPLRVATFGSRDGAT